MKKLSIVLLALIAFTSLVKAQKHEGKLNGRVYSSKIVGWTMEVPEGYNIISSDSFNKIEKKGLDIIDEKVAEEIDTTSLRSLVNFGKNPFTQFLSTAEPFNIHGTLSYDKKIKQVYGIVYNSLVSKGIKVDTAMSKEMVQGMEFKVLNLTIYSPTGEAVLHEIMYSRLINNYDFGVAILYSNDADKKEMMDRFKNSKFVKK